MATLWFVTSQALDRCSSDSVSEVVKSLSAHIKVPTPYTHLALSSIRSYPQRILSESPSACSAAASLFRMPLPSDKCTGPFLKYILLRR
jgi:hypothetical protein